MCANFQAKQTTLAFLTQIYPKMDFVDSRSAPPSVLDDQIKNRSCVPSFSQNKQI